MSHSTTPYLSKKRDRQFKMVFRLLMGMGVLIYWIYMTLLEQPTQGFDEIWPFILRMIQPKVLRHLIPLAVGWWLARIAALTLVELLYDLPDRHTARTYLLHRHTFYDKGKAISVTQANLEDLRSKHAVIGVGGPGLVQIDNGEVAITERNGQVQNIYEAGIHELGMLERIYFILNLKPQATTMSDLIAYTREYLPMTADITLRFRIDHGEADADDDKPYPVNKEAVYNIVYGRNVTNSGELSGWDGKAQFAIRFNFLKVIRKYKLSEIMFTEDVYANIHTELTPLVEKQLKGVGFNLISIRVTNIRPQNKVAFKQYTKLWQAKREIDLEYEEAVDKAQHELEIQADKSEAELSMIKAIIEGVDKARLDGSVIDVKTAVSLRLIQAMEGLVARTEESQSEPVSPESAMSLDAITRLQLQLGEQNKNG